MTSLSKKQIKEYIDKAKIIAPKILFPFPELLAFLTGIKPAIIRGARSSEIIEIQKFFPEIPISVGKDLFPSMKRDSVYFIVLAWNKKEAMLLRDDYAKGRFKIVGEKLGYPSCCVDWHEKTSESRERLDQNKIIFNLTQSSKKCYWYNNHLFNFTSRLFTDDDMDNYSRWYQVNTEFAFSLCDLENIFHVPCRFDCQQSLIIGKRVENAMKEYAHDEEKVIKKTLKRPVLFFDKFRWLILKGGINNNILIYNDILKPVALLEQSTFKIFQQGNKLICDKEKIKVFKDNKIIWVYKKKSPSDGFLINFQ